ncbi:MAG: glucose dehydrogenase, partial [Verrucomicrobiales bacterium]
MAPQVIGQTDKAAPAVSGPNADRKKYDSEAKVRIATFTLPSDVKAALFVDESQTRNPGAICFDHKGRLYIGELDRWRAGVEDIRNEQRLLFDDIANVTNADRLAMYKKDQLARPLSHYTKFQDRIVIVEDLDHDGRADTSKVWADGFNDVLDGPGIGLLSTADGSLYYTNIPHLWKLNDGDGDGKADKKESLQDGFGVRMSFSGHDMHGLIHGPDGKIYWSIGD